ncbi:MAG: hypothetical protein C5B51_03620 [Terriglobia bacterium]|nr:MAG: hypothetical protein C5B51_03620 [Terriglobia bacterium]
MADNRDLENRPPDLNDPEQRFEHRDVNIWAIGKVAIGLVLTTIASLILVLGVFRYLEVQENARQVAPAGANAGKLPPEPRLLENEPANFQQFRATEDRLVNGYKLLDPQKGEVKIPIDRAIDMLVQKGLPARPQNAAQPSAGVSVPTESSLGPKMQQAGGPLNQEPGSQGK